MDDDELEPLITRCPNCATQFRVTENQLAVASGRVRCGACLTVFQGIDHLLLDEETAFATGSEASAALDALLDELEPGETLAVGSNPDTTDVEPPAGEDAPVRFYGVSQEEDPSEAEDTPDAEARQAADAPPEEPDAEEPHREEAEEEADPETDAALLAVAFGPPEKPPGEPVSQGEAQGSGPAEPAAGEPPAAGWPAEPGPDEDWLEEDYEKWIEPGTETIDQMVREVVAEGKPAAAATAETDAATEAAAAPATGMAGLLEDDPWDPSGRPVSFAPEPRRWWVGGVAVLLAFLLAGQVFYLQLADWSRDPDLRPAYELVCGWLGCELPEMRSLPDLRTRNLVVRSHPEMSDSLMVDATIVNVASFAQRFPDLELRFTSVDGELVAGRRFRPEEYLRGEFRRLTEMPPNTPIQVSLAIVDPGRDAVNYTLSFR